MANGTLKVQNIETSSGSGTITLGQSGETITVPTGVTTTLTDGVSGDFKMNSGFGSVATAYGCRAWVNFNGTGTVAIRGSGNVSSITDSGTGDYRINFTNDMPNTDYCAVATATKGGGAASDSNSAICNAAELKGTTYYSLYVHTTNGTGFDSAQVNTAVFL